MKPRVQTIVEDGAKGSGQISIVIWTAAITGHMISTMRFWKAYFQSNPCNKAHLRMDPKNSDPSRNVHKSVLQKNWGDITPTSENGGLAPICRCQIEWWAPNAFLMIPYLDASEKIGARFGSKTISGDRQISTISSKKSRWSETEPLKNWLYYC